MTHATGKAGESTVDASGAPYLSIEHLTKQYGAFTALRDISLEIFPGEIRDVEEM